jgi:predicted DNA-binding protein
MAKKRAKKVEALQEPKTLRAVRLDLSIADHDRLEGLAESQGLTKAAYCRRAVLRQMKADEKEADSQ